MTFESLGTRITPAVNAFYSSAGILTVQGDSTDNNIVVSSDAGGNLLVNGGAIAVEGGTPTLANTARIKIFGVGGSDHLSIDETYGALPPAELFGGNGDDTLIGGSGDDMLYGEGGNDTLFGKGGGDFLFGGTGSDTLTGGDGDDLVFGQSGNDRMIWNPGDDTDLNEGGLDTDTIEVNGGNGGEVFTTISNGTRVRFDRLDPAPFSIDIGTSEQLILNANAGNDSFSATGNLAALIKITVDGGGGDDTLFGSNGDDVLIGGPGADLIDGNQGNDAVFMGAGDDVFQWDPGDGSDTVEGQGGNDTLRFNGSAANETFDASANGHRFRFTRNVGNIVMDLDGVEVIDVNALGGADIIIVNNLAGTDVRTVNANLALAGGAGDAHADNVIVMGTNDEDVISGVCDANSVSVVGLAARVNIIGSEFDNDKLTINSLGNDDVIDGSGIVAGRIQLIADGGEGDDVLIGTTGADVLLGGDGDDVLLGGLGLDVLDGGDGDDVEIQ